MRAPILRVAAAALVAVLAVACRPDASPVDLVPIEQTTFADSLDVQLAGSVKTPSGLYYRDLVVGTGATAVPTKQVSVHYDGRLADGTRFDANQPGDRPFSFTLGAGQVIVGWDQGVDGMKVGGKRQLVIPSELAYGPNGIGPIPGNAVLVFTVDLLEVR